MKIIVQVIIVGYVYLLLFILFDLSGASNGSKQLEHRQRRYLSFRNISHFFLRLNFKANMVPWNQIFAQSLGFRMNWDNPPDSFHPYHRLHRRTVYSHMEILLDRLLSSPARAHGSPDETVLVVIKTYSANFTEPSSSSSSGPVNGLEGYHCVRRAICEMDKISRPRGVYHKILKIIFRQKSSATAKWHNGSEQDCRLSIASCPFSMLEASPFTDT